MVYIMNRSLCLKPRHLTVPAPRPTHLAHNKGDILKVQPVMHPWNCLPELSPRKWRFHGLHAWGTTVYGKHFEHCHTKVWNMYILMSCVNMVKLNGSCLICDPTEECLQWSLYKAATCLKQPAPTSGPVYSGHWVRQPPV